MSPFEWFRGGCYFKEIAVGRNTCVSLDRYSCVSGSLIDRRLLL